MGRKDAFVKKNSREEEFTAVEEVRTAGNGPCYQRKRGNTTIAGSNICDRQISAQGRERGDFL